MSTLPCLAAPGLQWEQHDGYRVAQVSAAGSGRTGFTLLSADRTGILFTNQLSYELALTNQNTLNGSGVAAGDYDGDSLCDLYFCNLQGRNALFRNLGNWRFEDVTLAAGVACSNMISRGAAFADVNGDGALDLIVTSLLGPNALLLNDGRGHFTEVTAASGLTLKAGSESLALADVDGDGDLDLYIANNGEVSLLRSGGDLAVRKVGGRDVVAGRDALRYKIVNGQLIEMGPPDVLYLNDGKGKFTATSWTGGTFLTADGQSLRAPPRDLGLSVMFRDINSDGAPDLYVCNDFQSPDRIWINDGSPREITGSGLTGQETPSSISRGQGRFRALPDLAIRTTCHFSMGVDFADIDRDGRDDFFVSDMLSRFHKLRKRQVVATNPPPEQVGELLDREQARRNTLLWNRGDGTFAEIANYAGVEASDWTWSVVFLDVDLDGYEDLLIANGHAFDTQDLDMAEKPSTPVTPVPTAAGSMRGGKHLKEFPPLNIPNVLFRNRGNLTFEEVGARWGFDSTNVSHGISLVDLDNDGDQDVVVSCLWQPPLIYRNDSGAPRVAVRLRGKAPNVQGIGAKITVQGGAVARQSQEMICGGRYLAADDPMRVFAAGSPTNRLTIEVDWRSGARSIISNAQANCIYEIDEREARVQPAPPAQTTGKEPAPLFTDVSERLAHTHDDPPFNDLDRQPLLTKTLSRLGPGVCWFDFDGDGHDDLIVGAGKGGVLGVFRGDGKGGFTRLTKAPWSSVALDDLTGIVAWVPTAGQRALLVGLATYESPGGDPGSVLRIDPGAPNPQSAIRNPQLGSPGPLAVADLDGDGDLDVFAGGRVVPGRYPEAASSQVYRNSGGTLQLDEGNSQVLARIGLVSGAVFSDLNGDGWPELVLACEWGPLKIFRNERGKLTDWDPFVERKRENGKTGEREDDAVPLSRFPAFPLSSLTGWWNSVATGDLDSDGALDIIAGNWGLNSSYHAPTAQAPLRLYYGDFDGNGVLDLLEAEADPDTGWIVPRRDMAFLSLGLPLLRTRFATHKLFSETDLKAVLGDQFAQARQVQASTLASMVFLNRGRRFEAALLPAEAQFAPAFGLNVADLDGDGQEDVFLAQNFFALRLEEPRLDGGRGLWLRGDGRGRLAPIPGQESGVKVYGHQRGSAVCDFDEDGRIDLVVTQNGSATKLYRNAGARPGLRVRLAGPPANPHGLGAVLRLAFGEQQGPAREVHGGSGYWSQDSAVPVLATPSPPTALTVRWPGGKTTTHPIAAGAREIVTDIQK